MFHRATSKWERDRFHASITGFDVEQPHHDFLYEWGYLVREGGTLLPTRGAVALFGSLRGARQLLPKPVLDVRFLGYAHTEDFGDTRWLDRSLSRSISSSCRRPSVTSTRPRSSGVTRLRASASFVRPQ